MLGLPGAPGSDSHQEQTSFSCPSDPKDHILGTHGAATVNGSVLILLLVLVSRTKHGSQCHVQRK